MYINFDYLLYNDRIRIKQYIKNVFDKCIWYVVIIYVDNIF